MTDPESTPADGWNSRLWLEAVATATDITAQQKVVLFLLETKFSDRETGAGAWPSAETIGRHLSMSRQAAHGHMKALRAAGWLVMVEPANNRGGAVYRLGFGGRPMPVPEPRETPAVESSTPESPDMQAPKPAAGNGVALTPSAAADYLGCCAATVRRRVRDGTLPAVRFGPRMIRLRVEDLDAFLQSGPAVSPPSVVRELPVSARPVILE